MLAIKASCEKVHVFPEERSILTSKNEGNREEYEQTGFTKFLLVYYHLFITFCLIIFFQSSINLALNCISLAVSLGFNFFMKVPMSNRTY
jgi:hypothetical protein